MYNTWQAGVWRMEATVPGHTLASVNFVIVDNRYSRLKEHLDGRPILVQFSQKLRFNKTKNNRNTTFVKIAPNWSPIKMHLIQFIQEDLLQFPRC